MRKLFLPVLVLALLVAAVPAFAQDDEGSMQPTIADIVTQSANAEDAEFTTLLTAVQAADPAVLETLSDPEQSLTVFAPTDAAFESLFDALGEEATNELLNNPERLTEILLYHVVEGEVFSADVVNMLEENDGAFSTQTLQGQYIDISQTEEGIFIDGAQLRVDGGVDIEASNGVVHIIEDVITPVEQTIADIVTESANADEPQFTTLLSAVQAASPSVLEALSNPDAELTVFAPTDAAFEALGEDTLNTVLEDTELLDSILTYHVVEGATYAADIIAYFSEDESMEEGEGDMEAEATEEAGMDDEGDMGEGDDMGMSEGLTVTTLQGSDATITMTEEGVFINDAQIVMTDIEAANGVIHVIDTVLMPPMEEGGGE